MKTVENMKRELCSYWYEGEAGDYYFALNEYITEGTIMSCDGENCDTHYTQVDEQTPLGKLPWRAFEHLKMHILETHKKYTALEINDRLGLRTLEDWK